MELGENVKRMKLVNRLFELKNSEEFFRDDPKTKKEIEEIRAEIKAIDFSSMTPIERARSAIDERSKPTTAELENSPLS